MKRALAVVAVAVGSVVLVGASKSSKPEDLKLLEEARKYFQPLPKVAESKENPITPEKVELGKMLYYEPRLSKSGLISCNTCHNLATYGVDNLPTSVGHRWQVGPRNAPTTLNAALHTSQFWDGRAKDVEEQAKGPILNPIEMAMDSPDEVIKRLKSIPEYVRLFNKAFPNEKEPITYDNVAKAISAFERTLITPSRFDKFLQGDLNALTKEEKDGLKIFMEVGCASCHNGPALGGNMLVKFGIVEAYWNATKDYVTLDKPTMPMDVGRFAVTHKEEDLYVFKVPSLRNVSRTYPYFHDGSVWNLGDAVQVMAKVQLGKELTKDQVNKIVAFLKALDGEIPKNALELPVLPPSRAETPKPVR
ncbi:MAG: cytochrome-c peroxidase [Hydrogenobacter thermophilus]|uniref:cytochrome-c peroxidase n=1 Tax=Hydrogenobacter thermophilus TaxID=940 RepID=UPI001C787021|nr:cytochrome-c peroxidase [Hydrogenobacter thermophilus]QWK20145.1 MAG: cytochrome-c peroxidase [Hydrogenobacter thermophilus]